MNNHGQYLIFGQAIAYLSMLITYSAAGNQLSTFRTQNTAGFTYYNYVGARASSFSTFSVACNEHVPSNSDPVRIDYISMTGGYALSTVASYYYAESGYPTRCN